MKKSIVKKIAVLGAIGVMTLTGAESAFAAENEAGEVTSVTYMKECDIISTIQSAEARADEFYVDENNDVMVNQGGNLYKYHVDMVGEASDNIVHAYNTQELAEQYAQEHLMHNYKIQKYNDSYAVRGTFTYGNLTIITTHQIQGHSADVAAMYSNGIAFTDFCE